MDLRTVPFYNSHRRPTIAGKTARTGRQGGHAARGPTTTKGIQLNDTIHLHDLTPAERLVEEAAERGYVEEKELEAFADEHELSEEDMSALRTALEERDVIVRAETLPLKDSLTAPTGGTLDPLQLFMDAAGRHKLLTAADE